MSRQQEHWQQAAKLFDELAPLAPAQREQILKERRIDQSVLTWLQSLLEAHDAHATHIIDRQLDTLAQQLAPEAGIRPNPESFNGQLFGPWRAGETIGRGGMSVVLHGERDDGQFEMHVAIKLLDQAVLSRSQTDLLRGEIRILAELSHPGVAQLLDGGVREDGVPYLVMEYVDGEPIDDYCRRHALDLNGRIDLVLQLIDAVSYCHNRLVVHGDIKPSNVLVDNDGRARLVDFGIAGRLSDPNDAQIMQGARFCSPAYAAPERIAGARPAVGEDVFALGALLYELLSGERIRSTSSLTHLVQDQAPRVLVPPLSSAATKTDAAPVAASSLRGDLDAICARALAYEASDRYASARDLQDELLRWRHYEPVRARGTSPGYRLNKWLQRHRPAAIAAALVSVALLTGTGLALWQAERATVAAERAEDNARRAEIELQHANSIKAFLLSIFEAADVLREGGAIPDTSAILAEGAKRIQADTELPARVRIELLNTLADIHETLDLDDIAQELVDAAIASLEAMPEPDGALYASALVERGSLAAKTGEHERALRDYYQAIAVVPMDDPGHARLRASIYNHIGIRHAFADEFDLARGALDQAEHELQQMSETPADLLSVNYSARGVIAYNAEDYETALSYMKRSLATRDNANPAARVIPLVNIAAVSSMLGDYEQGLEYDQRAVAAAREAYPAGHSTIGRTLYSLGDSLRLNGRHEQAAAALAEARAIQQELGHDGELSLIDITRTRVAWESGQYAEAVQIGQAAQPMVDRVWGELSRESLQLMLVRLSAALHGPVATLEGLQTDASERLEALGETNRWHAIAQRLRWRLALSAYANNRQETASHWLAEIEQGPVESWQDASLSWRTMALRLEMAVDADAPQSLSIGENLAQALRENGDEQGESRSVALLALARLYQASADAPKQRASEQELASLLAHPRVLAETRERIRTHLDGRDARLLAGGR